MSECGVFNFTLNHPLITKLHITPLLLLLCPGALPYAHFTLQLCSLGQENVCALYLLHFVSECISVFAHASAKSYVATVDLREEEMKSEVEHIHNVLYFSIHFFL